MLRTITINEQTPTPQTQNPNGIIEVVMPQKTTPIQAIHSPAIIRIMYNARHHPHRVSIRNLERSPLMFGSKRLFMSPLYFFGLACQA
jgi:hypothetical protein